MMYAQVSVAEGSLVAGADVTYMSNKQPVLSIVNS